MFRVYYYGLHKWDNYLLDIDEDIRASAESTQELARESQSLHDTVREGFEGLRSGIEGLQVSIEDLRAEFQWGFSLLAERLDTQISIMTGIARKLDAINAALDAPLDKQARELFRIGLIRLQDGLDDKALESFLQSEQKNDVDFVLQSYIGKLYLYGIGVRDLQKAIDHLLLAARYAEAKRGRIEDWNRYAAEAYLHAAIAAYIEGEEAVGDGKQQDMNAFLEKAIGFLAKAASLWPEFLEIAYTRAKCCALCGKRDEVRQCFEFLSDRDRRYFLKAGDDKDFDALRDLLKETANHALANPGPLAQQIVKKFEIAAEAVLWARRSSLQSDQSIQSIDAIDRRVSAAKATFATLDCDLVGMDLQLEAEIKSLLKIAEASLASRLQATRAAADEKAATARYSQSQIEIQTAQMKSISGIATGFGFAALTYFAGGPVIMWIVFLLLNNGSRDPKSMNLGILLAFLAAIVVGFIVTPISTARKRSPFLLPIANLQKEIEKCRHEELSLGRETERVEKELKDYQIWRDRIQPTIAREAISRLEAVGATVESLGTRGW